MSAEFYALTEATGLTPSYWAGRLGMSETTAQQWTTPHADPPRAVIDTLDADQIAQLTAITDAIEALDEIDLKVKPSPFRRSTMACTGIEFCKLAIVETKERAVRLVDELERQEKRYGLVTMCAAGGMAPAIIVERIAA